MVRLREENGRIMCLIVPRLLSFAALTQFFRSNTGKGIPVLSLYFLRPGSYRALFNTLNIKRTASTIPAKAGSIK